MFKLYIATKDFTHIFAKPGYTTIHQKVKAGSILVELDNEPGILRCLEDNLDTEIYDHPHIINRVDDHFERCFDYHADIFKKPLIVNYIEQLKKKYNTLDNKKKAIEEEMTTIHKDLAFYDSMAKYTSANQDKKAPLVLGRTASAIYHDEVNFIQGR